MSPVPEEFDPAHVATMAASEGHMYRNELAFTLSHPSVPVSGVSGNTEPALITTPRLQPSIRIGRAKIYPSPQRTFSACGPTW